MAVKQPLDRNAIALRVAREFQDGQVVNLGYGMPLLCCNYVPQGRTVLFHSENGVLGYGPSAEGDQRDPDLINAGGMPITRLPGMSFFHHADSFAMIRGGHVDITVLGGMQVSEKGDLANWKRPERPIAGMGGAMDLVCGAKKVIIPMEHTTSSGKPKIVSRCTYPLTGRECVDLIVTDLAVIEVTPEGLLLLEVAPGYAPEDIQAVTEPKLRISPRLQEIEL